MKKIGIIFMAIALSLTMSQCNKEKTDSPVSESTKVSITLNVYGGNGSRVAVNTQNGDVAFENGDLLYVASNGVFVGTMIYNGTVFSGDIIEPTEGQKLQFYFFGNVDPEETLYEGTSTSCSVVISDQTARLPVISYAPSNESYEVGRTTYNATLLNKCALVRFDVTTLSSSATCITGFNNEMTIDFSNNTMTPSKEGTGVIKLASGSGEKWAILLPQSAVEAGNSYSDDGSYTGTHDAVPTINENDYLSDGIVVAVSSSNSVDLGLPSGILWATYNIGAHVPEEYGDYFAWGETLPKNRYSWDNYQHCNGSSKTLTKYCCNSSIGYNGFTDNLIVLLPEDDAATANWGSEWRMATKEEWQELMNGTTHVWTTWNGVNGWLFTAPNNNCLFLPAAGGYDVQPNMVGSYCGYWSSTQTTDAPYTNYNGCAYILSGYDWSISMSYAGYRPAGQSVRAVRSAN